VKRRASTKEWLSCRVCSGQPVTRPTRRGVTQAGVECRQSLACRAQAFPCSVGLACSQAKCVLDTPGRGMIRSCSDCALTVLPIQGLKEQTLSFLPRVRQARQTKQANRSDATVPKWEGADRGQEWRCGWGAQPRIGSTPGLCDTLLRSSSVSLSPRPTRPPNLDSLPFLLLASDELPSAT
jgi:hypothetical protein